MANKIFKCRVWIASLNEMVFSDDYEKIEDFFNEIYPLNPSKDHFMEFTGLKENWNDDPALNRDIYDCDIVEFLDGFRAAVEWNDDTCQWQYSDGSPLNNDERYACFKRIIGNTYEHPHLLNQ